MILINWVPVLASPLLGYLGQQLVAHYHADVSPRLWLRLTALGAILSAWAMWIMPPGPLLWVSVGLAWALLLLTAIDVAVYRLPDAITLPLIATGLAVSYTVLPDQPVIDHAVGACVGFAMLWLLSIGFRFWRGKDGLGLGDAKLTAAAGAWLGWAALPSVILIASLGGILMYGVSAVLRGRSALSAPLAFGGPLALAIWLVWLYGPFNIMVG
jgi:leader peptidase (prepilin peptidase) / N-methyltransferase